MRLRSIVSAVSFAVLLPHTSLAAIGDNAPSLPSTFVTSHPRLGAPDATYLTTIWTNRAGSAVRIFNAANAWDSTAVASASATTIENSRYLILAYLAANQAADASATGYLTQIRGLANLNGGWGTLYSAKTDGVTTGTANTSCSVSNPCTVTSASSNFTTACAGGTCVGKTIVVGGFSYSVSSLTGTTQINITSASQPMLNPGSSVHFSLTSSNPGIYYISWPIVLAYDWLYNITDVASASAALDATTKTSFLLSLKGYSYQYETAMCLGTVGSYTCSSGVLDPGPFSDTSYTRIQVNGLVVALAEYEPGDAQGLADLRYALDMWWNIFIPGWKFEGGGDYCSAENDAGTRTSNNAYQPGCGGGWHDGWTDYDNSPSLPSRTQIYLPSLLALANAYGQMGAVTCTFPDGSTQSLPKFFCDNSWIKNYAYYTMYKARPDYQEEANGSVSRGILNGEATAVGASGSLPLGSLDGLGEIYNDASLRSWARALNRGWCSGSPCVPDGNEPAAWPFYTPDKSANSVVGGANPRVNLATSRLFQGWNKVYVGTGWGESDTRCSISYGGNYWSHPEMDMGTFNCFSRGAVLLGYTGSYRAGSDSDHVQNYKIQAIAHNVPLIYDAGDIYSGETPSTHRNDGSQPNVAFPNDGGQRRVGSSISNFGAAGGMIYATQQPASIGMWKQNYEYYHMADLIGYQVGPSQSYTYVAIDQTASFNNHWSPLAYSGASTWNARTANSSNRSYRCQSCISTFTFIPSKNGLTGNGTAAYLVVYRSMIATSSALMKKDVVHFINQPSVVGNKFTWTRAELATMYPFNFSSHFLPMLSFASGNTYQYDAAGTGWCMLPLAGCNITVIGGVGREFEITDSNGPKNHNECGMYGGNGSEGQCTSLSGSITGINVEPFLIDGSHNTLVIAVDGGGNQTITLTSGAARTATQVVADINATLTGATATVEGVDPAATANTQGRVAITSNSTTGGSSNVNLVSGNAVATLGMTNFIGSNTGGAEEGLDARGGGLVGVADMIHPIAATSPHETGSYRIEFTVCPANSTATACTSGSNNVEDWFLTLYRMTSTGDTNIVSTGPTVVSRAAGVAACPANGADCWELAWKDNADTCSYVWTAAKRGAGALLTATGAGCKAAI